MRKCVHAVMFLFSMDAFADPNADLMSRAKPCDREPKLISMPRVRVERLLSC